MSKQRIEPDPTRPLKNSKHEEFARNCLTMTQHAAYLISFPKANAWKKESVDVSASMLASKLARRIEHLKSKAADSKVADLQELLEISTRIARGRLSKFVKCDEAGLRVHLESDDLDSQCIEEITTRTEPGEKGGTITKIKVRDPLSGVDRVAKLKGLFKNEPSDAGVISDLLALARELRGAGANVEPRDHNDA